MKEQQEQGASHVVLRGILIGGSIGMMASWFGYEPAKAFFRDIQWSFCCCNKNYGRKNPQK